MLLEVVNKIKRNNIELRYSQRNVNCLDCATNIQYYLNGGDSIIMGLNKRSLLSKLRLIHELLCKRRAELVTK